ncbi:hypothetical protein NC653_038885 [Populus alba x Populus x berolinensis]|uniref:Uncharacterized protein n=1 Tax=Populus alba x Populus x berolinensis TaxID=444605 RepID=A0AAD6L9X1_9ROSI|nr:hypothetical protein NC653_038885 [Populus alba x Populus x berolinensis]
MGEVNFMHEDDDNDRLETARARFSNVIKRHTALAERLSRDSDKMIFRAGYRKNLKLQEHLKRKVHMEVDRKAMLAETDMIPNHHVEEKITYRVGNKVICCLEGARIGIQYETTFAGDPCELYHLVLESKSFLEKMTVLEHNNPFLPAAT